MSKQNNFFEGLILGGIFGVIAGLLIAPETGDQTRKKIKDIKEKTKDAYEKNVDTEELVNKTLIAIDNGFEKLSKIVKKEPKSKTHKTK